MYRLFFVRIGITAAGLGKQFELMYYNTRKGFQMDCSAGLAGYGTLGRPWPGLPALPGAPCAAIAAGYGAGFHAVFTLKSLDATILHTVF